MDVVYGRGGNFPEAGGLRKNALGELFVKVVL